MHKQSRNKNRLKPISSIVENRVGPQQRKLLSVITLKQSYPPIRPQDRLKPIFKIIKDRRANLADKLDSIRTSQPVASQIQELEKVQKQILELVSLISIIESKFQFIHYTMQYDITTLIHKIHNKKRVPKRVRDAFEELIVFLLSLDHIMYNSVYTITFKFLNQEKKLLLDLNRTIMIEFDKLRIKIRFPYLLLQPQQQKQQKQQQKQSPDSFVLSHINPVHLVNEIQPPR